MRPLPNVEGPVARRRIRRGSAITAGSPDWRMPSSFAFLLTAAYCLASSPVSALSPSLLLHPCRHKVPNALPPRSWIPTKPSFQGNRRRPSDGGAYVYSSPTSTTALLGVRSSLREKLSRIQRRVARKQENGTTPSIPAAQDAQPLGRSTGETAASNSATQEFSVALPSRTRAHASTAELESAVMGPTLGTTAVLTAPPPQQLRVVGTESLYSLPALPADRRLTKLEVEFRDMLAHFTNYSESDLLSLRDPRMRTLFRGVAASAVEPPVYRAFEVLFEDLYPLRLAGRLVYKTLKDLMVKSQHEREHDVAHVVNETGLASDDVEATRLAFVSVAAELNGDAYLTRNQLERIDVLTDVAVNILNFESVDELLDRLERYSHTTTPTKDSKHHHHHPHGKLSFTDLIIGLQQCAEEMCGVEACNPAAVMHHIMLDLKSHPPMAVNAALDEKRRKFSERYDEMLTQFMEWEDVMPEGEGRRMDVVKGCFVGARNQPVVDALRIVYVDYSPLRVAGDIIFKLVSGVMRARQQRQQHHDHHHDDSV